MTLFREAFTHIRNFSSTFWVVIGATLMNQTGNMAFVFLVLYATQHLGLTLTQASTAFVAFSSSMLISGLLGGSLIDKLGAVRMMIAALVTNGIILLNFPLLHTYTSVIIACLLWGFAYGIYRPASQTFITHLSTPGMHKVTFSVYRLALNLGMSIGPAIGGYLASHSFAAIFIANGIANLLASLVLFIGLARSDWFNHRPARQKKLELSIRWLKYDKVLLLFVLGMIPVCMVFYQHESTLAVFLKRDLNLSLGFYGLLFTLNTLMIVFCELPLNVATMKWPYRWNFMLGSLFITAGFAGMVFATQQWHIILLTALWTIGEMILFPSTSSYIAELAPPERRGSYMSIYSTCSNIGLLLGPWGGAIVMEHLGASGLWMVCGLWGMLSVATFYYLTEPKKEMILETING